MLCGKDSSYFMVCTLSVVEFLFTVLTMAETLRLSTLPQYLSTFRRLISPLMGGDLGKSNKSNYLLNAGSECILLTILVLMTTRQNRWYYYHFREEKDQVSESLTCSAVQPAYLSKAGLEPGLSGFSSHTLITLVSKMPQGFERQSAVQ